MKNIAKLIKQKCAEYDITPDVLTPEELEMLKEEIEAEQRGEFVLDGIPNDPEVFSRDKLAYKIGRKEVEKSK